MNEKFERILLHHGSGGTLTRRLVDDLFRRHFSNAILDNLTDSAMISGGGELLAFTTDSYVVKPLFFPGGNIGKLAVCGTVNDLAVSGSVPVYLSAGFIIEEGFPVKELETIVKTMAETASAAGVSIVTGDTKVVEKGMCDGLFINTAGIGYIEKRYSHISPGSYIEPGDIVIINGYIGDHGMAIISARGNPGISIQVQSDCAPLNDMIKSVLDTGSDVKFMRDATRGGLATVLCEMVEGKTFGISLQESMIPVRDNVSGMCEMLGFDPLYLANEGKVVIVVKSSDADCVLNRLMSHDYGRDARVIGSINSTRPGRVILETSIGGNRIIEMLAGDQLPRIC